MKKNYRHFEINYQNSCHYLNIFRNLSIINFNNQVQFILSYFFQNLLLFFTISARAINKTVKIKNIERIAPKFVLNFL